MSQVQGRFPFVEAGIVSALAGDGQPSSYDAPGATLSMLVEELGELDLLKLDIEGAEFDVLLGTEQSLLRRIERIVAEVHLYTQE